MPTRPRWNENYRHHSKYLFPIEVRKKILQVVQLDIPNNINEWPRFEPPSKSEEKARQFVMAVQFVADTYAYHIQSRAAGMMYTKTQKKEAAKSLAISCENLLKKVKCNWGGIDSDIDDFLIEHIDDSQWCLKGDGVYTEVLPCVLKQIVEACAFLEEDSLDDEKINPKELLACEIAGIFTKILGVEPTAYLSADHNKESSFVSVLRVCFKHIDGDVPGRLLNYASYGKKNAYYPFHE